LEEFDAATKTGIDDIRMVIEGLMYRPLGEGASKAVIVDECHSLSKQAITALLKSLEDPPNWVTWFLCTTEPTKIPVAVKTRCLVYQLKDVNTRDLIELLDSTEEGKKTHEDILELCAKEAGGSPRQALSNLGVCMAAKDADEAAELLRSAADIPAAIDLARLLAKGASWSEACKLLAALKEVSPESVRHVVRAYMTSVVLGNKNGDTRAFAVLEEFSQPFNSFDGMSPLVLACGRLLLRD
jgi:DNA polymerase-3 subunit gamma/tau